MNRILLLLIPLFVSLEISAQTYPFDSIPGNLRKRADAVVRTEQCVYRIIKPGNAVEKNKKAITLLNSNTKSLRYLMIYYDKFSKVGAIKGTIYDEKGRMVKTLGMNDVYDMSAFPGGGFYSDDRVKIMYFPVYKYPYTIEYEYEISYSSLLNYPDWTFQDSPDVSVERSGIQIVVPKNMKFKFYEENLRNKVDSVSDSEYRTYTWQEENLPVRVNNQIYAKTYDSIPILYTAPIDFEYGGFRGSMSSWKTFGEWAYSLIKGLDALPDVEVKKISEITAGAKDIREKTRIIYEYMQSRTRYVLISIGIGGYKPASAENVALNGFGDCKALANYTMALLKSAGINSFYTLVRAGEGKPVNRKFVSNHFNHVILCVPMEKDSVWLDCTNQTLPFNYLGDFSSDRDALLITPNGGKMVRTPDFKKEQNLFKRTGSLYLNIMGASFGKVTNFYSGENYSSAMQFENSSEDEIRRSLFSSLNFSDFSITSASFTENRSETPVANLTYEVNVNNFASSGGARLFFSPSLKPEDFLFDSPANLEIIKPGIFSDSLSYIIPLGYKVDFLPGNINLENEFGKFRSTLSIRNDKIIFERYFEINKGIIPIAKFNEFKSFINSIATADRNRIILSKGT